MLKIKNKTVFLDIPHKIDFIGKKDFTIGRNQFLKNILCLHALNMVIVQLKIMKNMPNNLLTDINVLRNFLVQVFGLFSISFKTVFLFTYYNN